MDIESYEQYAKIRDAKHEAKESVVFTLVYIILFAGVAFVSRLCERYHTIAYVAGGAWAIIILGALAFIFGRGFIRLFRNIKVGWFSKPIIENVDKTNGS